VTDTVVEDAVLTERRGAVLVITLNRPDARNAIDHAIASGIAGAVDELEARDELRAAVITGAGRGFCAGMDLKGFADGGPSPWIPGRGFAGIVERPARKPMVAAIEGFAVAGGLEIALACDVIVAATGAKLGFPEVTRGLVATGGALRRLPARVPRGVAMELALTGALIRAERAHEVGLVDHVTETGGAAAEALRIAGVMAENAPLALVATKRVLDEQADWETASFWSRQDEVARPVMESDDAREGAIAFAEKRPPVWTGH
jgi:enoyl-CoA hydratase